MLEIFKHFVNKENDTPSDREIRRANALWFTLNFPQTEFEGLDNLLMEVLNKSLKFNIPLTTKMVEVYNITELPAYIVNNKFVLDSDSIISFENAAAVSSHIQKVSIILYEYFEMFSKEEAKVEEFPADMLIFIREQLTYKTQKILEEALTKRETDIIESTSYLHEELERVRLVYDETIIEEIEGSRSAETRNLIRISDFGLPTIDEQTGGIYSTRVYDIEADTGFGKSRFTLGNIIYRTLVLHKKDVLFYALEQDKREVRAMLIAVHVYNLFKKQISTGIIETKEFPTEEHREIVEAAEHDLFESGKYGTIDIQTEQLYVNTFVRKINDRIRRLKNPGIVSIDYMGIIEGYDPKYINTSKRIYLPKLDQSEIISEAYKRFKRFIGGTDLAGVTINQFNRSGSEKSMKGQFITSADIMGGLNVHRHVDFALAFIETPEMLMQNVAGVCTSKARNSEKSGNILKVNARKGSCLFYQQDVKL